jgi:hypothetical protein
MAASYGTEDLSGWSAGRELACPLRRCLKSNGAAKVGGNWHSGNAADESGDYRGWLVGHFIGSEDGRRTAGVEVKWGVHAAGEQRRAWTEGEVRSTLVILVSGKVSADLSVGSVTLAHQGDYLAWGLGLSIRGGLRRALWPSRLGGRPSRGFPRDLGSARDVGP